MPRPIRPRFADGAAEAIRHLHPQSKRKVRAALKVIASAPDSGKPLKAELDGLHTFRVGKLRIVYRVLDRMIDIVAFGPRDRIYEETRRLVRRSP